MVAGARERRCDASMGRVRSAMSLGVPFAAGWESGHDGEGCVGLRRL